MAGVQSTRFPLSISANSRYFVDRFGNPFFLLLDAAWSGIGQCSPAQIDQYLTDRASRGFTGTIVELTNMLYSSQQPTYLDQAGESPFGTITAQGASPFGASACDFSSVGGVYWPNIVDYYFQASYKRGMVVVAFPAYTGFPTTPRQGWYDCIIGDTAAHLQTLGAWIAGRYGNYGNAIWGMAGDNTLSTADLAQHWNIATGMRSVRTDLLIYAKAQRDTSGYAMLTADGGIGSYPGFNVNNVYVSNAGSSYTYATDCATEYARSPTMPFFCDETDYEGYTGVTDNDVRRGLWGPPLGGACNACFGNGMLWGFGGANNPPFSNVGPSGALIPTYLDTNGAHASTALRNLFITYHWEKLVPKTDASLVTTSLGTGAATICPALASDGTFAFIYTGSGTGFTVNLAAFSIGSIPVRWFDPTNGAFTPASGSPFANSGTHAFTIPGTNSLGDSDWVLVLG